jgi:hypothetical protein
MAENNSIGALWEKQSKKGTWFSGSIEIKGEKISIVAFKNEFKTEGKHPDYKILISKPKEERCYPASENVSDVNKNNTETDGSEDLPF